MEQTNRSLDSVNTSNAKKTITECSNDKMQSTLCWMLIAYNRLFPLLVKEDTN